MKPLLPLAAVALLACGCHQSAPTLGGSADTLSWAMGQNIGLSLKEGPLADRLDNDLILQAVAATLDGKPSPLTDEQYQRAFEELVFASVTSANPNTAATKQQQDADQSDAFAQLRANPAVHEHPSGFLYECVTPGHGPNAKVGELVRFDYQSRILASGEVFDDSHSIENGIQTVVGKPMFPGMIDALQLMNAGSTYRIYFPYEMLQSMSSLPAYTPLVYEVELHEILR